MMETAIYYVALGKDVFLTCGFFIHMINRVTGGNFPYTLLKQQFEKLRCEDLEDCWYSFGLHRTFSISSIMVMIMFLVADVVSIFMGDMMLSKAHG